MIVSKTVASVCVMVVLLAVPAMAVNIETVPVGNPGNAADARYFTPGFGAVDYSYNVGKYEVTAGQYTEFLNAVAATDTYGLYITYMWSNPCGCKIQRSGSTGSYTYSVADDRANRPVNWVSWGDAARFANWLQNGQPTGMQGPGTTEDGSYLLNGATSDLALMAIVREPDATWVIPTEDEWYKAAYHKNDPSAPGGNYWDYPTDSDSTPGYVNDNGDLSGTGTPFTEGGIDPGNYATYDGDGGTDGIGSPYYTTQVGEWENSASPYGTFDQGGNISEWNETEVRSNRGVGGASFLWTAYGLRPSLRTYANPSWESFAHGFRVARIPEPATMVMLVLVGVGVLRRRRA